MAGAHAGEHALAMGGEIEEMVADVVFVGPCRLKAGIGNEALGKIGGGIEKPESIQGADPDLRRIAL